MGYRNSHAMDKEGIDIAFQYPTKGLAVLGIDSTEFVGERGIEPAFATAIARAYNDWMYDFCSPDPKRLIGIAMVAPHDVNAAVAETRRCVKELGFKGIFLLPGLIKGRPGIILTTIPCGPNVSASMSPSAFTAECRIN